MTTSIGRSDVFCKGNERRLNISVNPHRRSLKAVLLLFVDKYAGRTRDTENYINPEMTNVSVTVNGLLNKLYDNGFERLVIWEDARRYFIKEKTNRMISART